MDDFTKADMAYKSLCEGTGQIYEKPSRMYSETENGILTLKTRTGSILGQYEISSGKVW